jgi:hypothetical protein
MAKLRPLSSEMAACLLEAEQHGGKLIRHPGGYWSWPDCPRLSHNGLPESYFLPVTIMALIARDRMEYVEWQEGKRGRFPIAAAVRGKTTEANAA